MPGVTGVNTTNLFNTAQNAPNFNTDSGEISVSTSAGSSGLNLLEMSNNSSQQWAEADKLTGLLGDVASSRAQKLTIDTFNLQSSLKIWNQFNQAIKT